MTLKDHIAALAIIGLGLGVAYVISVLPESQLRPWGGWVARAIQILVLVVLGIEFIRWQRKKRR